MKAAGNQAKTACGSLQLCAGLDSEIKGETHVVEQRRRERTAPALEGKKEEKLEDRSIAAAEKEDRDGDEAAVGGVGEVPEPPGGGGR